MGFTFKSRFLIAELQRRQAEFRDRVISSILVAPEELQWWLWLEYGTASRGEPGHASGHDYEIDPVNALFLSWPTADGRIYRTHVQHPGIYPRRIVRRTLPDIRDKLRAEVVRSLVKMQASELASVMKRSAEYAKERIAESLSEQAPGTRDDGRLKGKSASDVWREAVTIE